MERTCIRCGRGLADEMGCYVFVMSGGRYIRGPWDDALLCVEHGHNGANGMSLATWNSLTGRADTCETV